MRKRYIHRLSHPVRALGDELLCMERVAVHDWSMLYIIAEWLVTYLSIFHHMEEKFGRSMRKRYFHRPGRPVLAIPGCMRLRSAL
jgi:hypothetical protein